MESMYKLTLKDKIILSFKETRESKLVYLLPKVRKHSDKWFELNEIRKPIFYGYYVFSSTQNVLSKYEIEKSIK